MYTFTIHGADGVGKSTACKLVRDIFAGYPVVMDSAHHVTSWKRKLQAMPAAPPKDVSFLHRILRVIYRASPQFARDMWVTSTGYHRYSKNVNAEVFRSYVDRKILLLDRYIYDLSVKDSVRQASSDIGDWLSRWHCYIMRRPLLAILLQDEPGEVIKRKQELSQSEIDHYQRWMREMLLRLRVNFKLVEVDSRTPDMVARDVAVAIIQSIGTDLHALMRDQAKRPAGAAVPGVRDS